MATNPVLQWLEGGTGTSNGSPMPNKITVLPTMSGAQVQALITSFAGQAIELEFEPGTYNWTSGLTFTNYPNVLVKATGATIMCNVTDSTNYFQVYYFSGCGEVNIVGGEVDYTNMPFAQGICTAATTTTATFQLDTSIGTPTFPTVCTIEQQAVVGGYHYPVLVTTVGAKTFYPFTNNGDGTWTISGLDPAIGAKTVVGQPYVLLHRKFPYHIYNFLDCGDVTVSGTKSRTAAGIVFYATRCTRATFYDNEMAPPPGSTRWKSATGGSSLTAFIQEFCRFHRNRFIAGGDDSANISNGEFSVTQILSSTSFVMSLGAANAKLVTNPGDVLDFIDSGGNFIASGTILTATGGGTATRTVTMAAPIPVAMDTTWLVFSERYNCRIQFEDNETAFNTGRGVVATGAITSITGNTIYYHTYSAISVANVYSRVFHQGVSQSGVDIVGNMIEGCANPLVASGSVAIDLVMRAPAAQATFTGSISGGTTLTVSGVSGTILPGTTLFGANVAIGTTIVSGSGSTWLLDTVNPDIAAESMKSVGTADLAQVGAASDFNIIGNSIRNIPGGGIAVNGWSRGAIIGNTFTNVCSAGYGIPRLRSAISLSNVDSIVIQANCALSGNGNIENLGSSTNVSFANNFGMTATGIAFPPSTTSNVKVTQYSAAGTYTFTPNGLTVIFRMYAVGAGGGGGSGAVQNIGAACSGGGGGGGGGSAFGAFTTADIPGPRTVTIGAGGTGGAAPSSGAAVAGNNGTAGGSTAIGAVITASGGSGGAGGQLAGNSGGGGGGAGPLGTATAASGSTAGTGAVSGTNNGGSGTFAQSVFMPGLGSGGGGGANGAVGGAGGWAAMAAPLGASGGGAGGGIDAGNVAYAGGASGYAQVANGGVTNRAAGGAVQTVGGSGIAGGDINNPGSGGGGGGAAAGANAAGAGGAGARGGGGGGGGSCQVGGTAAAGGNGGDGFVAIVEYLSVAG